MVYSTSVLIKLFFLSFNLGPIAQLPIPKENDKDLLNSKAFIKSDFLLNERYNNPENTNHLPDPSKFPVPSASEPLIKEHAPDNSNSNSPITTNQKKKKHKSKVPVHEICETSLFDYLNVKFFEYQNLETEPQTIIKPIYSSIPFADVEISYREEKRKVVILVPVEKEEEREVLSWMNVTEEIIDENNRKKITTRCVQVPTIKKIKRIEMIPQEFETLIKIPEFKQVQTSITVETLTGIRVTVPQITTKFGVLPNQIIGEIYTPTPNLNEYYKP